MPHIRNDWLKQPEIDTEIWDALEPTTVSALNVWSVVKQLRRANGVPTDRWETTGLGHLQRALKFFNPAPAPAPDSWCFAGPALA